MKKIQLLKPDIEKLVEEAIKKGYVSDWEIIKALGERNDIMLYRIEPDGKEIAFTKKQLAFALQQNWEIRGNDTRE